MHRWTKEDVCWWLGSQNLGKHQQTFSEQEITGETLLALTTEELKGDLHVNALGDRKKLLDLIQKYREWTSPRNAPDAQETFEEERGDGGDPDKEGRARAQAGCCDRPPDAHGHCVEEHQQDQHHQHDHQEPEKQQEHEQAQSTSQAPPPPASLDPAPKPTPGPGPGPGPGPPGPGPGPGPRPGDCKADDPSRRHGDSHHHCTGQPSRGAVLKVQPFPTALQQQLQLRQALTKHAGGSGLHSLVCSAQYALAIYRDEQSAVDAEAACGSGFWVDGDLCVTLHTMTDCETDEALATFSSRSGWLTDIEPQEAQAHAETETGADADADAAVVAAASSAAGAGADLDTTLFSASACSAAAADSVRSAACPDPGDLPGLSNSAEDRPVQPAAASAPAPRKPSEQHSAETWLGGSSACPAASPADRLEGPEADHVRAQQASRVLGYAISSQRRQHGGSTFFKSLSVGLRSYGATVEAELFNSVCRIAWSDPSVAEQLRTERLPLGDGDIATFLTNCTAFFISNIPAGLVQDEMAAEVMKAASVEVKHCAVNPEDGTGVILVTEGRDAEMLTCMGGEMPICGAVVHLSPEPQYRVYLERLPSQVVQVEILKAFQNAGLQPKSLRLKDGHAEVLLKNAQDRDQALARPMTLQGVSLPLLRRSSASVPFSSSWYETAIADLKSVDAIPPEDLAFRAAAGVWDASLWLSHLERCQQSSEQRGVKLHGMRRAVMIATVQAVRQGEYRVHSRSSPGTSASTSGVGAQPQPRVVKVEEAPETRFYNLEDAGSTGLTRPKETKSGNHFPKVSVTRQDCLLQAFEILQSTGEPPLVLNMASDKQPGGGYLVGDAAQEETLFRRSNYYQTLGGLDDIKGPKYPWPGKFCAAFSPGVSVFRGTEQAGYPFLEKPFKVDLVAVAAERNPPLTDAGMLTPEHAAILRRKVELIFLVALKHRKRHLVLSALGCGAFHNPPQHVAEVFRAVLLQYGPLFHSVTFAIVEDHNSRGGGNLDPFGVALHQLDLPQHPCIPNDAVDPAVPCQYGGCCKSRGDPAHCGKFAHPPPCPRGRDCADKEPVHRHLFTHRQQCEQGGECTRQKDKSHTEIFDHPQECSQGARCTRCDPEHMRSTAHSVPICKHGSACLKKSEKSHSSSFRHPVPRCHHGRACFNLVPQHRMDTDHDGLLPLCPRALGCRDKDHGHQHSFSHFCLYGAACTKSGDKSGDPDHFKRFIHLSRVPCKDGKECSNLHDLGHLANFSHAALARNTEWPREECCYGAACNNSDMKHHCEFIHPPLSVRLPPCEVRGLLTDRGLDFHSSKNFLTEALRRGPETTSPDTVASEIVEWVKSLQPLHRCKLDVFESMCAHGVLMSASHMKALGDPEAAVRAAQNHPEIVEMLKKIPAVKHEFVKRHMGILVKHEYHEGQASNMQLSKDLAKELANSERSVGSLKLEDEVQKKIEQTAKDVAKASLLLSEDHKSKGIHYHVDTKMKTDKHIFSIVGPHTGCYYGGIVLVLKPDIMHHPDFFLTVNAATSYHSGRANGWRPWCDVENNPDHGGAPGLPFVLQPGAIPTLAQQNSAEAHNLKTFERSALHPCVHEWEKIVAAELASMTAHVLRLHRPAELKDILKFWSTCDSHTVIEGHLPNVVPLAYVERILVPADEKLSDKTMEVLKSCFGEALKDVLKLGDIQSSQVELTDRTKHGGSQVAFQRTLEHAAPSLQQQHRAHLRGFTVSLPGGMSSMHEEAVLPLALSSSSGLSHLYLSLPCADIYGNPTELFVTIKSPTDDKVAVHIFLTASLDKDHISYITGAVPSTHVAILKDQDLQLASAKGFNAGCLPGWQIDYHVQVDAEHETVKVSHAGLCARFSPTEMQATCSYLPFDSKLLVSLSTRKEDVCVTGIAVRNRPLPLPKLSGRPRGQPGEEEAGEEEAASPAADEGGNANEGMLSAAWRGVKSRLPSWNGTSSAPPKWQWEAAKGWYDFEEASWHKLEDAHNEKKKTLTLNVKGMEYDVDLVHMTQKSLSTNKVRNIRRFVEGDQQPRPEETVWQVKLDSGWEDLDNGVSLMLSQKEAEGKKVACFERGRTEYEIDFQAMRQTNLSTKRSREVRKHRVDSESHPQCREEEAGKHSNEQPSSSSAGGGVARRMWQVCVSPGCWADMDKEVNRQLQAACASKKKTCRFHAKGQEYEVDFGRGVQVNLKTHKERAVRPP